MDDLLWREANPERPKSRKPEPSPEQIGLWAESGSEHDAEIALLIPIAQRLAREAGTDGVTIADVREEAARRAILPPLGKGRSLSYLGSLLRRAGLTATDRTRRSTIDGAHGNRNTIWVAPEFVRESAA